LTGSSDIYGNNNAGDEEHTRIYQAFAPSLLLDEMTLNSDELESQQNQNNNQQQNSRDNQQV
jgi:hypothetical protein